MARGSATNVKIRELVIAKYSQGKKIREIADELDLAKSTVGDILKHYRDSMVIVEVSNVKAKVQVDREL